MSNEDKQIKFRASDETKRRMLWATYWLGGISQQDLLQKALDQFFDGIEREYGPPAEPPRAASERKHASS